MPEHTRTTTINLKGLKQRAWSETMVRDLLGAPHETKVNPMYRNGPPMRLYRTTDVLEIEATPAFSERMMRAKTRRKAANKVVVNKEAEAIQWATTTPINITFPKDINSALEQGLQHWRQAGYARDDYERDGSDADLETRKRWAVNFIRHQCSNYDQELGWTFGRIGGKKAYEIIRRRINSMIEHWWLLKQASTPELGVEQGR